jgi:hypothetical protein
MADLARRAVGAIGRGPTDEIDERIARLQHMLTEADDRAAIHNDLGNRFRDRYLLTGQTEDLDTAIEHYQTAIAMGAVSYANGNMSAALVDRYNQRGDLADLEAGIAAARVAVAGADAPVERARHLANLTHALHELYYRTRRPADLDEAIASGEEALGSHRKASRTRGRDGEPGREPDGERGRTAAGRRAARRRPPRSGQPVRRTTPARSARWPRPGCWRCGGSSTRPCRARTNGPLRSYTG